jgi:hypothetical protein
MKFTKGMSVVTKNGVRWYVREEQITSKYLRVVAKDGFETLVDIGTVTIYR